MCAKGNCGIEKAWLLAAALFKKRYYWPKHVDGDAICEHFANKNVGDADALSGLIDAVLFYLYGMKEPDYVMTLMTTYGTLERLGEEKRQKLNDGTNGIFCYPVIIHNHFKYCHAVDDHNNRQQLPISIERTWTTSWQPNRVFAFLLGMTKINVLLALHKIFNEEPMETLLVVIDRSNDRV